MRPTVRVSSETDWRSVPRLSPYGNWDSLQPPHSPDSDTQERTDELTPSFHKVFQTEQWSVQLHVWMLYTSEYSGWTFRYKLKTFSEKWSFRRVSNCQNSHRKQADETEWISQGGRSVVIGCGDGESDRVRGLRGRTIFLWWQKHFLLPHCI